jgi:hypothetical protein
LHKMNIVVITPGARRHRRSAYILPYHGAFEFCGHPLFR